MQNCSILTSLLLNCLINYLNLTAIILFSLHSFFITPSISSWVFNFWVSQFHLNVTSLSSLSTLPTFIITATSLSEAYLSLIIHSKAYWFTCLYLSKTLFFIRFQILTHWLWEYCLIEHHLPMTILTQCGVSIIAQL
jgi:hypothetical protein